MFAAWVPMTAEDEAALPLAPREYLLITERGLAAIGFGPPM
jgi:hypothetical protein